jgi:hypothetical protein
MAAGDDPPNQKFRGSLEQESGFIFQGLDKKRQRAQTKNQPGKKQQ